MLNKKDLRILASTDISFITHTSYFYLAEIRLT